MSTAQGKKLFDDWQNALGAQNLLLFGLISHIPEQQLRNHLSANMNADTKLKCDEKKVHNEPTFATWIEKFVHTDPKRLRNVDKQTRLVEDAVKRSKAPPVIPQQRPVETGRPLVGQRSHPYAARWSPC